LERHIEYNEGNPSPGKEKKTVQTTVTIEFTSDTKQHIRTLEHQLKHIHDVKVDIVVPKDLVAPVLVAIGITKGGERAEKAAQNVAQTLYGFLREDTSAQSQKKIFLVTIEGERIDIESLPAQEIERIILEAFFHYP